MKFIYLYEEFTDQTLKSNINIYNQYYNDYKDDDRSKMVAWGVSGSQERNFKMVSSNIKNGYSVLDYGCGIGDFIKYLNDNKINISNYLGVDINNNFIELAKKTYPNHNFIVINDIDDITGKWDIVCAIGVFTWFITKQEFIDIIYKLYNTCNKQLLLTFLNGETPYDFEYDEDDEDQYWNNEYKYYSPKLFKTLFNDLNISYQINKSTLLIKIDK